MPQYTNVKNIAQAELAGCLPLVEDLNNFELLKENLTCRIALFVRMPAAREILEVITDEAGKVEQVPFWEYIINELQHELRVASSRGPLNEGHEGVLISKWTKHIIRKKDVDTALDFIAVLKTNRLKRNRTI